MDTIAPSPQSPPSSWSVGLAIVVLWINVAIGCLLLTAGTLTASVAFLDVVWGACYAGIAIGLMMKRPIARTLGIWVAIAAYAIGLLSGQVLSTTLIVLVALLLPPTGHAVALWKAWRQKG